MIWNFCHRLNVVNIPAIVSHLNLYNPAMTQPTQTQMKTKSLFQSIREVLPDSQMCAIIDLREKTSAIQWQAGDLVNDIYVQVMANKVQASIMDVCYFVSDEIYGLFAPSTLRIYAAVAKFYLPYTRGVFVIYPYWMFRYATRFATDWQKVFKWADLFMDTHARLPYEREVRAYFEPTSTMLNQLSQPEHQDCQHYLVQLPPEVQAVEQAGLERECKSTLKVMLEGLLSLVPLTIGELKNDEASQLLSQIGALSRQMLEQYL